MRTWLANFVTQPIRIFLGVLTMANARQQKDVATRLDELKHLIQQLQQDIEDIRDEGEIAPSGCWIVRNPRQRTKGWSLLVLQMDVP